MPIKGVLVLIFFAGSIPICFIRPFYGILLWMIIAFLNPQSAIMYWSVAQAFPWAIAIGIPTIAGCLVFCPGWLSRIPSRESVLMLLFWGWTIITSIASEQNPMFVHHAESTWYHWRFVSKILLMTFVTMGVVNSFERLRILVLTVAGCFGVYVAKSLPFVILTGGAFRLYGPAGSMIAENNDFGHALNMTLPLYFFLAQTEENPRIKRLFSIQCWMTDPASMFTYSRGALVGMVVVLILMFLGTRRRLAVFTTAAVALVMIVVLAPESWTHRMDPTRSDAIDGSALSRLNAWGFAWKLASDYPVAGGGYGTFTPQLYARYADNPQDDTHGAHSVYFQVLGEHGFVGLGIYMLLVLSALFTVSQLIRRGRREQNRTLSHYANMFRFSLIGFLVPGAFWGGRISITFFCSLPA